MNSVQGTRKDPDVAVVPGDGAENSTPRAITVNHAPYKSADARPFWAAVAEKRLVLQRCVNCGHIRFPPRHMCPKCWAEETDWITASGRGRVHSFTIVHRAPTPTFQKKAPYVLTIVDLEEGPRMVANILGEDATSVQIGDAVAVTFDAGSNVPQFKRQSFTE